MLFSRDKLIIHYMYYLNTSAAQKELQITIKLCETSPVSPSLFED